jgi:hypothetical protein
LFLNKKSLGIKLGNDLVLNLSYDSLQLEISKKKIHFWKNIFLFRYCLVVKNQPKIVMFGHSEHFWQPQLATFKLYTHNLSQET